MATLTAASRMMGERAGLEEENTDYKVFFKDDTLLEFVAYVYGTQDSLYRHKLIKLKFDIPEEYPFPPVVTFIQHSGGRVHPNLYLEGLVCLSILGTWPGEQWNAGLSIHTILISIRSLLDDQPYRHEPGRGNSPEYNKFVQFTTWRSLLLDYIQYEDDGERKKFVQAFIRARSAGVMGDVFHEQYANRAVVEMSNPYSDWKFAPDYDRLIQDLKAAIAEAVDA